MFVLPPVVIFWLIVRFRSEDRVSLKIVEMVFLNPYAMVLGLAMILGWPVAAYLAHPEVIGQWRYELASRAVGEIRRDSVFAYFGFVALGTLPWCLFVLVMFDRRLALLKPAEGFIALWFASGFALLSLAIAFKAQHYCLPILLPVLLASAAGFGKLLDHFVSRFEWISKQRSMERLALIGWFGVFGIAWLANQWFVEPPRMNRGLIKPFAADIHARVPTDQPIYLLGVGEDRIVWYLEHRAIQARKREEEPLEVQIGRLPREASVAICPLPKLEEIRAKVRSLDVLVESADYRGRDDGLEKRALVRIEP
jgi:hypothetical protein